MADILVSTINMSTDEWYEWRKKGIGGSDVAAICGISKYKSPVQLWMEKTNQIEPEKAGESAYWGTIMEPIIRQEFTIRTNLKVKIVKAILKHPQYDFMLANLDGIAYDPEHGDCIFEAKTASAFKQVQWEDCIPEEYMLQVQHYMAVTGYKRAYVAALIGGNYFKYKVIQRDEELINMIIRLESNFWKHVKTKTPPSIDGSEASSQLLSKLFPDSNKMIMELPAEAERLINQYETAKEREKEITEMKDEAVNKLKMLLGENEKGEVNDKTVIWKTVNTEKLDTKKLQSEAPEVYSQYLMKNSFRRFSIK